MAARSMNGATCHVPNISLHASGKAYDVVAWVLSLLPCWEQPAVPQLGKFLLRERIGVVLSSSKWSRRK